MKFCRVGLAQINTTVGDFEGNLAIIRKHIAEARRLHCDIIAFPELAITGYPPEDLLLRKEFCQKSSSSAELLKSETEGIIAIVGFVDWHNSSPFNAAAIFADGDLAGVYHKRRLPNYGVFDEERYFSSGRTTPLFHAGDLTFGVSICEDIWYPGLPLSGFSLAGAELCININASPFSSGRVAEREQMLSTRAVDNSIALAYVNAVGGQDELVFDGSSFFVKPDGALVARASQFVEELLIAEIDLDAVSKPRLHDPRGRIEMRHGETNTENEVEHIILSYTPQLSDRESTEMKVAPTLSEEEEVWKALVVGVRDYLDKTGFEDVLIGLSGGIDSSLVAAIAVDALGPSHVIGVSMPSRYSSEHSRKDAKKLAKNLGIKYHSVPIEPAHTAMLSMLSESFEGEVEGLPEENLQSRLRGNILMSLANKNNAIVLTTGNKSEMATGYATLYGDLAGGFAVIKDVPKTLVYKLAKWRNLEDSNPLIPDNVISKPPSAELRPEQLDTDSLPEYEILDPILEAYVERDATVNELISAGFQEDDVRHVISLIDRNEYKRRQSPPGVKITQRAFGRDRRLPLAQRYSP